MHVPSTSHSTVTVADFDAAAVSGARRAPGCLRELGAPGGKRHLSTVGPRHGDAPAGRHA